MEDQLNMLSIKMNFKGIERDLICQACKNENKNTEHFLNVTM